MKKLTTMFLKQAFIGLILFLSFFHLPVSADETTSQRLSRLLTNIQTMQAQFSQVVIDPDGKKIQEAQGQMSIKRPRMFFWETKAPNNQIIVSDGTLVSIYDKDLAQVTRQKLDKNLPNTPALILSGAVEDLDRNFLMQVISQDSHKKIQFELNPVDRETAMFEKMRLSFADKELIEMYLEDNLGQKTTFKFSDIELNEGLRDRLFQFEPPEGVDILDQTQVNH